MKKTLSYTNRVKLEKIFLGIIWTVSGIVGFFDSIPALVVQIIAFAACIYTLLKISFMKKEGADEMAEQNMNRAKAMTFDCMLLAYCCVSLFALLFLREVNLTISLSQIISNLTFLSMGITHLAVGLIFRKYEEE